jgi:hypothetical protein
LGGEAVEVGGGDVGVAVAGELGAEVFGDEPEAVRGRGWDCCAREERAGRRERIRRKRWGRIFV